MPNKRGSSRREGAPPQTPNAVLLDTPAEQRGASSTLGLHSGLEGVDGSQNHAECRSTAYMAGKSAYGLLLREQDMYKGEAHQIDAKMV